MKNKNIQGTNQKQTLVNFNLSTPNLKGSHHQFLNIQNNDSAVNLNESKYGLKNMSFLNWTKNNDLM